MITPRSYAENLAKSEKTVNQKVKAYLQDPSEENVHDLRTSIRRLLTVSNILPKKIREEKEPRRHLDNFQRLLKLNAEARDTDIILSKLPHHGDDPAFSKLAKSLTESRKSSIRKAFRAASDVRDQTDTVVKTDDISSKKIQKRFKRAAKSLSKNLKSHLAVVVKDPKNSNELHKLREDSRRLRFTLEMDDSPETGKILPVLEKWQDVLGKIRDSDIFISHFKRHQNSPEINSVLEQEKAGRRENYEKFLEIAKESPRF